MILPDTSIWIEYFRQKGENANKLETLLNERLVLAFEPVFAELFYGVRNSREKKIISSYWKLLPRLQVVENMMIDAAEMAAEEEFIQLGIGLIDALIILAVLQGEHRLWTIDQRVRKWCGTERLYP